MILSHFPASSSLRIIRRMALVATAALTFGAPLQAQTNGNNGNAGQMQQGTADDAISGSPLTSDPGNNVQASPSPRLLQSPAAMQRVGSQGDAPLNGPVPHYTPGEFETYVQTLVATPSSVHRFGMELVTDPTRTDTDQDPLPAVSADYVIKPGDEIALTLWGGVDADLRLVVDRAGRISIPRVGSTAVAGTRYGDLHDVLTQRVGQVFRNFQLNASMGRLRAIRVFVTGYAQRPGSMTVSSLSSVLHVLMRAGGPAPSGSFRDIELKRGGKTIAVFDLYDLLLKGDRTTDQTVQPDDVIHIGPIGVQVAVLGSVNQPAIYELRPGENLTDLLRMAGGFNAVADRSQVVIERLSERSADRVVKVAWTPESGARTVPGTGDVVRVMSAITALQPSERQNKRVTVEGEVVHPGEYVLPPGSRISDAIKAAGGMTPGAFVYGTVFTRETVRQQQRENFDRALKDLETNIAKASANTRVTNVDEASASTANANANQRLIEHLRENVPTGRVVLQLQQDATSLPEVDLESGDRILVPPRSTSVGVFGSVFNASNFLYSSGHTVGEYLRQAGGPTAGADTDSTFLIRANGTVISARQNNSFWSTRNVLLDAAALPGDTVFVPEQINKSTFMQGLKDWTQVLSQFGIGIAAIHTFK